MPHVCGNKYLSNSSQRDEETQQKTISCRIRTSYQGELRLPSSWTGVSATERKSEGMKKCASLSHLSEHFYNGVIGKLLIVYHLDREKCCRTLWSNTAWPCSDRRPKFYTILSWSSHAFQVYSPLLSNW